MAFKACIGLVRIVVVDTSYILLARDAKQVIVGA
jgi:hypothetical protein